MSLLLEALKKAEKAKEEAQRRTAGESSAAESSRGRASSAPAPGATAGERKGLVTRDKLPEVSSSTPLEIVEDDAPPPQKPSAAPALEFEASKAPPSGAASARRGAAASDEAGRATAKKVFEAKFREPNPRLPFYITVGVLGLFAVGTVVYFWYQLRPPMSLVNANPPRNSAESAIAAAPRTPLPTAAPAAPVREAAIPGLPEQAGRSATAREAPRSLREAPAPRREPRTLPREAPRLVTRSAAPVAPAAVPAVSSAVAPRNAVQVNPHVQAGYAAYRNGDLVKARGAYEEALRDEPANRDALLGLAALDVRGARLEAAEARYLRVLEANPRDAEAQAALLSLRAGRSDPLATESRIKSLLAAEPAAHALNFALGNQLAQQNRWGEAHQEYLKAYTAEPDNADFAYNVAVGFDHLHQTPQALDYYRRALALARSRGASFDVVAVRARVAQLAR